MVNIWGSGALRSGISSSITRLKPTRSRSRIGAQARTTLRSARSFRAGDRGGCIMPTYQQPHPIPEAIGADVAIMHPCRKTTISLT